MNPPRKTDTKLMVPTAERRLRFSQGVWLCVRGNTLRMRSLVLVVNAFQDCGAEFFSEVVEDG